MVDPSRLNKSSTTIKQSISPDKSATTPSPEQKKTQEGITSAKDSFEVKQESSLFTANPDTGEVKFGDGLTGKTPPIGTQNIAASYNRSAALLQETKSEISSYLKGEGGTVAKSAERFGSMKEYLIMAQNQQIDSGMKEAGEKADIAMQQATTGMVIGIAQGAISIGAALDNLKHTATEAKSDLAQNPALESRYQHFTSLLDDLERVSNPPSSKHLQQEANRTQIEQTKMEQAANKTDAEASASSAHRDRVRDAILDFLNKLRDIDPRILS